MTFQILSEMDVYQVSCFVDTLYDLLTAEDWWHQEIKNIDNQVTEH